MYQAGAHRDRAPGATHHGGKKPLEDQEKERPGVAALGERAQRRVRGRTGRRGATH